MRAKTHGEKPVSFPSTWRRSNDKQMPALEIRVNRPLLFPTVRGKKLGFLRTYYVVLQVGNLGAFVIFLFCPLYIQFSCELVHFLSETSKSSICHHLAKPSPA